MKYFLYYDYGTHNKISVEVSSSDFFMVVDDLSTEFEIRKNDAYVGVTEYFFIDYVGEPYVFGVAMHDRLFQK